MSEIKFLNYFLEEKTGEKSQPNIWYTSFFETIYFGMGGCGWCGFWWVGGTTMRVLVCLVGVVID